MNTTVTTEKIETFEASQVIIPGWMRDAIDRAQAVGMTAVSVTRKVTGFGTFVMKIEGTRIH